MGKIGGGESRTLGYGFAQGMALGCHWHPIHYHAQFSSPHLKKPKEMPPIRVAFFCITLNQPIRVNCSTRLYTICPFRLFLSAFFRNQLLLQNRPFYTFIHVFIALQNVSSVNNRNNSRRRRYGFIYCSFFGCNPGRASGSSLQ